MKQNMILLSAFLSGIIIVVSTNGQSAGSGFSINGYITGVPDGESVYLVKNSKKVTNKMRIPDTVAYGVTKDGYISLHGSLAPEGQFCFLHIGKREQEKDVYLTLLLQNRPVTIRGMWLDWPKSVSVEGLPEWQEQADFRELNTAYKKSLDSIESATSEAAEDMANLAVLKDIRMARTVKYKADVKTFWYTHLNSLYTPFLIRSSLTADYKEKQEAFNKLGERAKSSYFGQELKKFIEGDSGIIMQQKEQVTRLNKAVDFSSATPDGTTLSLKEVMQKGKLTLLDFSASWCGPCRTEMPNVKKVYDAFHPEGFNILMVSLDTQKEDWLNYLSTDNITEWYNVSDLQGRTGKAGLIYDVFGIPANFLINKDGVIVARDLRGEELYKKVAELMEGRG